MYPSCPFVNVNRYRIFKGYLLQIGQVSLHGFFSSEWKLFCLVGHMITQRLEFCLAFWKTILNLHYLHQTRVQSRLVSTVVYIMNKETEG